MENKKLKKKHSNLIRWSIFKIEEILPFVILSEEGRIVGRKNPKHPKNLPGAQKMYADHPVWMTSLRYQLFVKKGLKCVGCGLTGSFFALETSPPNRVGKNPHFNLYATDDQGDEVLMTKDHITPIALGGEDSLENLQTMCFTCNRLKGAQMPTDETSGD